MATTKIKGRIIIILDKRTVVINLGRKNGITTDSIFYIIGTPEVVRDPVTNEELGAVTLPKSRVKAVQVFDKFCTASTKWIDEKYAISEFLSTFSSASRTAQGLQIESIDEGELNVDPSELQPWVGKSKASVRIGDEVEVSVEVKEPKKPIDTDAKKTNNTSQNKN
jgi:hypothetical protein